MYELKLMSPGHHTLCVYKTSVAILVRGKSVAKLFLVHVSSGNMTAAIIVRRSAYALVPAPFGRGVARVYLG